MTTQRLIIAAGWLAAAVLAVLVGVVAISVIGDGLVSSAGRPLAESEVAKRLAAEPDPTPSVSAEPTREPAPAGGSKTRRTPGGTVTAQCTSGEAVLHLAPALGFEVHEVHGAEGEFRSVSDNHDRVKVRVSCAGGAPEISVEHEQR
ncbi:hypothetical protein [Actinoplanes sp. NPDC049265]|uniref:hypothetical protein n=1 Tax=Actinoplanes sp. NPDC049265 TaxID=3363902 RepID=UPI00372435D7